MSEEQPSEDVRYVRQVRIAAEVATLAVAAVLLASASLPTTRDADRTGLVVTAVLLLAFTAVFFHLLPQRTLLDRDRVVVGAAAAQAIAAYLVATTGGLGSNYFSYYVLPTIGASLSLNLRSTLAIGVLAMLGLGAISWIEAVDGVVAEVRDRGVARAFALATVTGIAGLLTWTMERTSRALIRRSAELAEHNRELEAARSITVTLSRLRERDEIIRGIFSVAQRAMGTDRVWVFIGVERDFPTGWTTDASGTIERYDVDMSRRNPPRLRAVREQRTVAVEDALQEEDITRRAREQFGLRAAIFVPLVHRGQTVGIATFSSSQPRAWTPIEIRLAETIAEGCAAAIATYLAFDELRVERERLGQRTRVLEGLANLSDSLAISPADDVAARAAARSLQQSFALRAATVLFTDASLALLEPRASSGEAAPHPVVQNPHTCPAIRSGRLFRVASEAAPVQCPYVPYRAGTKGFACAPLAAVDQTVGAIFLESADGSLLEESLVRAAADRIALHVANQRVLETAQRQAVTDGLTGLYNRHFMGEQLKLFHSLAERHGRAFSVIAIDVDGLKRINDTFGHEAGDLALRALANAMRRSLRTEDVPVRTGGDEFVAILPDTALDGAVTVAERIRAGVEANAIAQPNTAFTVSMGVAAWRRGRGVPDLLNAADGALYKAKNTGRDRVASEAELTLNR